MALDVTYDLSYYASRTWGVVNEDDKYYHDEELMDNFLVFYAYAFAHLNLPAPTRAQLELAKWVSDRSNPHRMLMCMRGLSKSLTSQIYVVWRLLNDPNEKILVMSAGATRATNYSQFVQKLIKLLPITRNMSPRHNIERTSGQSFDVAGAVPSDSPSVYAVGVNYQIAGFRASLIVYDDIETAQSVESATLSEKINTYAMEAQNLLMSGKDESITLCTPHSMSSIYIDWIARGHKPLIIPSEYPQNDSIYWGGLAPYIKERVEADPSLVGQAVDERLNKEFLESKKMRIGKAAYALQYMIDTSESDDLKHPLKLSDLIVMDVDNDDAPMKISHSTMPENRLDVRHNGFKKDRIYAPAYVSEMRQPYEMKILSIDPSGRGADRTGVSMIFSLNTRLFIKKITGLEGGYEPDTLTAIAVMCRDYGIDTIVIESNWSDGAFTRLLEPYLRRISPNTEIDEIRVSGQKEVRIIEVLEPMANQHRLVFDKSALDVDYTQPRVHSFTEQYCKISKVRGCLRHDDAVDSLANGVTYMLDKMNDDQDALIRKIQEEENQKLLDKIIGIAGERYRVQRPNYANRF